MFQTQLGNNIAVLRAQKNLTAQQLGAELNLPTKVIENWESGLTSPNETDLNRLAEFFGVSVVFLQKAAITDSVKTHVGIPAAEIHPDNHVAPFGMAETPQRVYEKPVGSATAMYVLLRIAVITLVAGFLLLLLSLIAGPIVYFLGMVALLCSPIAQAAAIVLFMIGKEPAPKRKLWRILGYGMIILYFVWEIYYQAVTWSDSAAGLWTSILDILFSLSYLLIMFLFYKNKEREYGSKKSSVSFKASILCALLCFACAIGAAFGSVLFAFFTMLFQYIYIILLALAKKDRTKYSFHP